MVSVPKISKVTVIRTVLLVVALVNQGLAIFGKSPLPFSDESISNFISLVFVVATTAWAWWKDNDFTKKARVRKEQIKRK